MTADKNTNIEFVKLSDDMIGYLHTIDGVPVKRERRARDEWNTSYTAAEQEVNSENKLHGTHKMYNTRDCEIERLTYKDGLKHGVLVNTQYWGYYLEETASKKYFWEDQETNRVAYWFKKNADDLKTGNPKVIWNALFKSNEMTKAELDTPAASSVKAQDKLTA